MSKRQQIIYSNHPQGGLLGRLFSFAAILGRGDKYSERRTQASEAANPSQNQSQERYIRVTSSKKAFGDTAPVIMSGAVKTILANKVDAAEMIKAIRGGQGQREIHGRTVSSSYSFKISDETVKKIAKLNSASDDLRRVTNLE